MLQPNLYIHGVVYFYKLIIKKSKIRPNAHGWFDYYYMIHACKIYIILKYGIFFEKELFIYVIIK